MALTAGLVFYLFSSLFTMYMLVSMLVLNKLGWLVPWTSVQADEIGKQKRTIIIAIIVQILIYAIVIVKEFMAPKMVSKSIKYKNLDREISNK
eukprot:GAHX01000570.1.p1 GENE.GAHX01000570.1~~GAHX01000570.1.p1  ORF type:complete len:108 (+),score=14.28 GAHX01000570.1:46-324(+)